MLLHSSHVCVQQMGLLRSDASFFFGIMQDATYIYIDFGIWENSSLGKLELESAFDSHEQHIRRRQMGFRRAKTRLSAAHILYVCPQVIQPMQD